MIYMFSDGFTDQNASNRMKYGRDKFVNLLKEIAHKETHEQNVLLNKELEEYKEKEDQRDDITVMGLRL